MRTKEIQKGMKERLQVLLFGACLMCVSLASHAQALRINVQDAQFTRSMMEKLITEYNKVNPQFSATIVNASEQADAYVSLSDRQSTPYSVGRFVIVPIANSQNEILSIKKVAKGLSNKLKQQIFVERDELEELEAEEEGEKKLPGTVYSLTGKRAITTQIIAKELNITPNRVRGKKNLGHEENLISVVQNHPDAIAFNVASLVYDTSTHKPVDGITVLAFDLDGNDRISEEERLAIASLDELTAYLDKVPHAGVPTGSIDISTDNDTVKQFVAWMQAQGQDFLAQYGFLKAERGLTAQK